MSSGNHVQRARVSIAEAFSPENSSRPLAHPCTLLSQQAAQSLIGHPIGRPVEAPQGPTCVFPLSGTRSAVTISVESIGASTLKSATQHAGRLAIGGHAAYCGAFGRQMVMLELSANRFLAVTGRCLVAERIAARVMNGATHMPA